MAKDPGKISEVAREVVANTLARQATDTGSRANEPLAEMSKVLAELIKNFPAPIVSKWYFQQRVHIDGYRFERCRFDNCEILVTKGSFRIDRCFFSNCTFLFNDEALRVAKIYTLMSPDLWDRFPGLSPTVNGDGTLSIS